MKQVNSVAIPDVVVVDGSKLWPYQLPLNEVALLPSHASGTSSTLPSLLVVGEPFGLDGGTIDGSSFRTACALSASARLNIYIYSS
jgi:hypothetical protein